jgi:hypothetical protein
MRRLAPVNFETVEVEKRSGIMIGAPARYETTPMGIWRASQKTHMSSG